MRRNEKRKERGKKVEEVGRVSGGEARTSKEK